MSETTATAVVTPPVEIPVPTSVPSIDVPVVGKVELAPVTQPDQDRSIWPWVCLLLLIGIVGYMVWKQVQEIKAHGKTDHQ